MDVLILLGQPDESAAIARRLRVLGYRVTVCSDVGRAMVLSRSAPFDLLISSLVVRDDSALGVVMSAQHHNDNLGTILLSDGLIFSQGELFSMIASLRCVMSAPPILDDLLGIAEHILEEAAHKRETILVAPLPRLAPDHTRVPRESLALAVWDALHRKPERV